MQLCMKLCTAQLFEGCLSTSACSNADRLTKRSDLRDHVYKRGLSELWSNGLAVLLTAIAAACQLLKSGRRV